MGSRRDDGRGFSRRDGARLVGRPRDRAMSRMDRMNDYNHDYRGDMAYDRMPRDYNYEDYRSYDYSSGEDVKELMEELKKKDRYGMSKEQVIHQAKTFGSKFTEYDEDELYVTYLMMQSDYEDVSSDPMTFIKMAIDFLEDDDAELRGSEKLASYISCIVYGD